MIISTQAVAGIVDFLQKLAAVVTPILEALGFGVLARIGVLLIVGAFMLFRHAKGAMPSTA